MALTATAPTGGDDILATWGTAVVADLAFVYANSAPIGSITMWAGSDASLPTNWKLCNGDELDQGDFATLYGVIGDTFNNSPAAGNFNLPDMRDRFVVGAGTTYSRNSKGGASSMAHTHSVTSNVSVSNHSALSHSGTAASFNKTVMNDNQSAHTHNQGTLIAEIDFEYNSGGGIYYDTVSSAFTADTRNYLYGGEVGGSYSRSNGVDVSGLTGSAEAVWTSSTVSCSMTQPASHTITAHSVSNPAVTSGAASNSENRPPYIGLFYIIKYQ